MKIFKYLLALTIILSVVSCKNDVNASTKIASVEKGIQNIEVAIEGMTCEIGCAKLIESKIHKLEGVSVSEVDFENKIGKITFDNNLISSEEIVKNITGIAGGELYKVTDIKTIK
jgi:Cu+-exporting ATPase